ncbi:hypothetical protein B0T10DRAFT_594311 [Thelonectria olida]|uniref:Uncharacterized protein n=1 Tax=Thelonectria olida TaxID=1576542 RepID=A0A9P8W8I6_9HYPO|nr:hypothetical protein B0T10DRAFT_594311 [Thelonectria olida]
MDTKDDPECPSNPSSGLESLPLHLLESISGYVAYRESNRKSLFAFALASKICCRATDRERFRHVRVHARAPKQLRRVVQKWQNMLDTDRRLRHVRILTVSGSCDMKMQEPDDEEEGGGIENQATSEFGNFEECRWGDEEEEDNWCRSSFRSTYSKLPELPSTEEERKRHDEAWLPVAQLCRALPGLRDILYTSLSQMPRCLLSALHDAHPTSRLHMQAFNLRSLGPHPDDQPQAVDPDELALATSPCLFSLTMITNSCPRHDYVDYNEEAVMAMIKGAAPRLTNVRHSNSNIVAFQGARLAIAGPRPPWRGFRLRDMESAGNKPGIGHLQSLFLGGGPWTPESIVKWSSYTDFRNLRLLWVQNSVDLDSLLQLVQMADDGHFANLQSLSLVMFDMDLGSDAPQPSDEPEIDDAIRDLLQLLSPLKSLRLTGSLVSGMILDAIISHHGGSLRRLKLLRPRFSFSLGNIREISQKCPELEELEIMVRRLQGGEEEVKLYRALGTLPRLERLNLLLDCAVKALPRPDNDDDQDETFDVSRVDRLSIPMMQQVFMNAAMDSTLALDIFRVISRNNSMLKVKLRPTGMHLAGEFGRWVRCIGKSWMVRRNPNGEIVIQEVRKRERAYFESFIFEKKRGGEETQRIKAAWDGLWPPRSETRKDDWSSFPLAPDVVDDEKSSHDIPMAREVK